MIGMNRLMKTLETKIKLTLPTMFAVMFDGWSAVSTYYLAVFTVWSCSQSFHRCIKALLVFTTLQDESYLRGALHEDTLFAVLKFYEKDFANVACMVGDNSCTNKFLARNTNLCFIGCVRHRLDLCAKSVTRAYESLLSETRNIMVFLRGLKPRAKLRQLSTLAPVLSNVTRWSSMKGKSNQYTQLQSLLVDIFPAILQLSPSKNCTAHALVKKLEDLDALTKVFPNKSAHIFNIRKYLFKCSNPDYTRA